MLYFFEYGRLAIIMVDGGDQGGKRDKGAKLSVMVLSRFVPGGISMLIPGKLTRRHKNT